MKWSVAFITSVLIHGLVFAFLCFWFAMGQMGGDKPNISRPLQLSLQQVSPPVKPQSLASPAILNQPNSSIVKLPEPVPSDPILPAEKPKEVMDTPISEPVLSSDLSVEAEPTDLSDQMVSSTISSDGTRHLPTSLSYKEQSAETVDGWGMSEADPYAYLPSEKLDKVTYPLQEIRLSMPESLSKDISSAKLEIRVYINKAGKVDAVEVVNASPPGVLEYLARQAFAQTDFEIGMLNGESVAYYKNIEILLE